jgi:hypothetical protein
MLKLAFNLIILASVEAVRSHGSKAEQTKDKLITVNQKEFTNSFRIGSDFEIQNRACFSFQIGFDYLQTNMEKMVQ